MLYLETSRVVQKMHSGPPGENRMMDLDELLA